MTTETVSVFGTQFTASAVIVFLGHLLEYWFPRVTAIQPHFKRMAYWLLAVGTALGVHASFNEGTGTLVLTGLTVAGVAHGAWHWVQATALQEFVHRSTK